MQENHFFITGMARSGTTLLDKLLNSHSSLSVLSQPFPLLYRKVKTDFFKSIDYPSTYYVLNDLFNEHRYTPAQFQDYLKNYKVSKKAIRDTFLEMQNWSGQYTKVNDIDALLEGVSENELSILIKDLTKSLVGKKNESGHYGTKETLVEEFIPYYISRGVKIILITRDPRDIITSLNFGQGTEYGGQHRPTLFHIRNWRKSIALANTFLENDLMLFLKYEDLLSDESAVLEKICRFLNVDNFSKDHFDNGIKTSEGKLWEGNSSTGQKHGIDSTNTAKYKKYLSTQHIKYIEQCCFPEMLTLGYTSDFFGKGEKFENVSLKEPYKISDETNLNPDMSRDSGEVELEKQRFEMLVGDVVLSEREIVSYFYSMENYAKLRETLK